MCVCVRVCVCVSVCHEFSNLNLEDFEASDWSMAGGRPAAAFLLVEPPAAPAGRDFKCYKIVVNMSQGNGSSTFIFQVLGNFKISTRFYRQNAKSLSLKHDMTQFQNKFTFTGHVLR